MAATDSGAGGETSTWLRAGALLMVLTVASRLVGFLRDTLIADRFGASHVTDAYIIAYMVPTFLVAVLSGALNAVVVPRIVDTRARQGEDAAWALTAATFVWVFLLSAALSWLLAVASPLVVEILAPGFVASEHALATALSRILVWSVLFSTLGYLAGSVLNAYRRFAFAALAPMLVSGTAAVALAVVRHPDVRLLADALLVGSVLQFLLVLPPVVRMAGRRRLKLRLRDPGLPHMARLSLPVVLSSSVGQANVIVDRIFGSGLAQGSITALAFADRVVQVPLGVFGAAVSTAVFTDLSEAGAKGDRERFRTLFAAGLSAVLVITIPVSAGLVVFSLPVVDALFRHGAFSAAAARLTARCLAMYALALIPYSLNVVVTRAYYVAEETLFIGLSSLGMLVLNALLDWAFVGPFGAPGLALSTVAVQAAYAVFLIVYLRRLTGRLGLLGVLGQTARAIVATLPAVAAGLGVAHLLAGHHLLQPAAALLALALVYLAAARLLGVELAGARRPSAA